MEEAHSTSQSQSSCMVEDEDLEERLSFFSIQYSLVWRCQGSGRKDGALPMITQPIPPCSCPTLTHLQIASRWAVVDLDIAVVRAWQQLTIPEPGDCGTWVGKDLTGDVHLVPLPCVHRHRALELRGICNE